MGGDSQFSRTRVLSRLYRVEDGLLGHSLQKVLEGNFCKRHSKNEDTVKTRHPSAPRQTSLIVKCREILQWRVVLVDWSSVLSVGKGRIARLNPGFDLPRPEPHSC